MKICGRCKEHKPDDQFYWKNKAKGTKQYACMSCCNDMSKAHYTGNPGPYKARARVRDGILKAENRAKMIDYLRVHPCVDCGTTDIEVLQADHIDPTTKTFDVANQIRRLPWHRIEEELNKCEIRCANCHLKRTRRQFGWWIDIYN